MTRQVVAHHVAKVFALVAVGRTADAREHARILISWLEGI